MVGWAVGREPVVIAVLMAVAGAVAEVAVVGEEEAMASIDAAAAVSGSEWVGHESNNGANHTERTIVLANANLRSSFILYFVTAVLP